MSVWQWVSKVLKYFSHISLLEPAATVETTSLPPDRQQQRGSGLSLCCLCPTPRSCSSRTMWPGSLPCCAGVLVPQMPPSITCSNSKHYCCCRYIMQHMTHHLIGAGRIRALRSLLAEPLWLEIKLHSYGLASVVSDFRRCVWGLTFGGPALITMT